MKYAIIGVLILGLVGVSGVNSENATVGRTEGNKAKSTTILCAYANPGIEGRVKYLVPKGINIVVDRNYGNWIHFVAKSYGLTYEGWLYVGEPNVKLD